MTAKKKPGPKPRAPRDANKMRTRATITSRDVRRPKLPALKTPAEAAEWVKNLRAECNVSLRLFAELAGLSAAGLSRIEHAEFMPRRTTLVALNAAASRLLMQNRDAKGKALRSLFEAGVGEGE